MKPAPRHISSLSFALLAICFFGSGFTGLVYEIVWLRRLQFTFGSTTYSITTVLAAFMAGLGFGSYLIGRRVDRSRFSGIRIYGLLELGIGLYALISLPLLSLTELIYIELQTTLALGHGGATVLKLLLSFPVLALPAALMGGTLPAMVSGLLARRSALHTMVGKLYGFNTAGAALGTALAGFVLIEYLGLWRSVILAAAINLCIAVGVLLSTRSRKEAADEDTTPHPHEPLERSVEVLRLRDHLRSPPVLFCSAAVILTGCLSMVYEVVWARLLSLVMGSSAYSFTIVLSIFLVGIALGALAYSRLFRDRTPSAFGLALVLMALALWVAVTIAVIPAMPRMMMWLNQVPGVTFFRVMAFEVLLAAFLLLIPTLLLGAALPMAMGIISRALGKVGTDVGGVYLANTAGAIAGSVLTGFVFIPMWGTQTTLVVGLWANLVLVGLGVVALGGTLQRRVLGATAVALVATFSVSLPSWPASLFDSGIIFQHKMPPAETPLTLEQRLSRQPSKLLFFREGINATISVRQASDIVSLFVNGKPDASSKDDMPTQVVLGIVATMAHPRPRNVAVVGWGSGVTTHCVTFFPEVQRIDAIEIERAVVDATVYFHEVNGAAERNPRVNLVYDDARSYLQTTDQQYDVIISEPSNPWMAGTSALFSRDFYRLVKRKLRPGGIFGQWLQLYRLDSRSVALIMRTVLDSFSHAQLWYSHMGDVILLGSDKPIRFSPERVKKAYAADPRLPFHMSAHGPGAHPDNLFGCFLLDRKALSRIIKSYGDELMTDDLPVLEYRAARGLYRSTHTHMTALWKAKLQLGQLLPPMNNARASMPGSALAGATTIFAASPLLRKMITSHAIKLYPNHPEVRLQRAKYLLRTDRYMEAQALILPLLVTGDHKLEATFVDGRIQLGLGNAREAFERLDRMGNYRPIGQVWFGFQAALAAKKFKLAWAQLEKIAVRSKDTRDPDSRRLDWAELYQKVHKLITLTRDYDRGIRFLKVQHTRYHGDLFRLMFLTDAYVKSERYRHAAYYMERLLQYGLLDERHLLTCEQLFRKVKKPARAQRCREQRLRLGGEPLEKPLWGKK